MITAMAVMAAAGSLWNELWQKILSVVLENTCYNELEIGKGFFMSILEANLKLLSTNPEDRQKEIQRYFLVNFCENNPYKPLSGDETLSELAESRACYARGEGEDFDKALDGMGVKYGL